MEIKDKIKLQELIMLFFTKPPKDFKPWAAQYYQDPKEGKDESKLQETHN